MNTANFLKKNPFQAKYYANYTISYSFQRIVRKYWLELRKAVFEKFAKLGLVISLQDLFYSVITLVS